MRRIKVAWDICFARRNVTGTGVYAARLVEQLTRNEGLELRVFGGWPLAGRRDNRVERALTLAGNLAWTHADLPLRLRQQHFDLLHSPAFVAPIKSPCPVVITMHDITHLLYPSHFGGWWVRYLKSVAPITVRSAAAIICGSEHSKRDLAAAYSLPRWKIHVIAYGVDHQRFHPSAVLNADWARGMGLRQGYVLHVGELSHRKNIPTLLRAIGDLRSLGKWGDRQLVLAGAAARGMLGADEIHKTIRELELASSVLLLGRVADEQLPGLYANASLLVMPSLYEGFGFPVVEAMATGTPVVTSNTSSLPEVAGDAAILVPPEDTTALGDAIFEVLSQPSLAVTLKARGLQRAQQFNWERTASKTCEVYRSIAAD